MQLHPSRSLHRAFTLIELLVVVAVIGLLIALLLPTLSAARQSAFAIKCAANLRTCGMGFSFYAQAYNDYFPTVKAQHKGWQDKLGDEGYLGAPHTMDMIKVASPYATVISAATWPALECPAEAGSKRIGGSTYYRYDGTGTSFNGNWYLSRYGYGQPRPGWSRGPAAAPYRQKPSTAGILMDIDDKGGGWTQNYYFTHIDRLSGSDFVNALYAFRHQGNANRLFMDGHVGSDRHRIEGGPSYAQALYSEDAPSAY